MRDRFIFDTFLLGIVIAQFSRYVQATYETDRKRDRVLAVSDRVSTCLGIDTDADNAVLAHVHVLSYDGIVSQANIGLASVKLRLQRSCLAFILYLFVWNNGRFTQFTGRDCKCAAANAMRATQTR